jgi:hypothetical protein
MATKILGLDALTHIKDYVDGTSSNINYRIDTEIKNHIADKIAEATTNIQADYDTQYNELINRISFVEQNGTVEELAELRLKLDALDANTQNKFNALDGISRELEKLTVDYQELYDGVTTGSVFSAGQLNEIINTAMIDSVDINPNAILTPEMYASKLVSLIGNFGQINAANIIGGDIKGHTISSNNVIAGTEDPVWTIKDEGDGWLAKKNIQWDKDGNVTFGEGVQLKFNNISDADKKLNDLLSNYDKTIKEYVQNATLDVNTEQELINLLSSSTIPTTVDGDMVMSPNVIAQKLVSLVGTFGTVNASNIVGEDIQGYTLSSPRTKKDSEGNIIYKEGEYEYALDAQGNKIQATDEHNTPLVDAQGNPVYVYAADKNGNKIPVPDTLSEEETAWILRADGTGHLANGNISWDEDGNVEFGEKVKLTWNSDWDEKIPAIPEGGLTENDVNNIISTTITKDYVESLEVRANDIIGDTIQGKTIKNIDGTWEINKDGNGYLASGNVQWTNNTFNVKDSIKLNDDGSMNIGPIQIDNDDNIIDNSILYYDLYNIEGWPANNVNGKIDSINNTEIFLYNSGGYTSTHIQLPNADPWVLNLNIQTIWVKNKFLKIYVGELENQPYQIKLSFINKNSDSSDVIKIIGASKVGNGSHVYPTTDLVPWITLEPNKSYLFKCDTGEDIKNTETYETQTVNTFRFITTF